MHRDFHVPDFERAIVGEKRNIGRIAAIGNDDPTTVNPDFPGWWAGHTPDD